MDKELFLLLMAKYEELNLFSERLDDAFGDVIELPIGDIVYDILRYFCKSDEAFECVDSWMYEIYVGLRDEGFVQVPCLKASKDCPMAEEINGVTLCPCSQCEDRYIIQSYEEFYEYIKDCFKE